MYKKDLVLNNLQWLICHKTKPSQAKQIYLCNKKKKKTKIMNEITKQNKTKKTTVWMKALIIGIRNTEGKDKKLKKMKRKNELKYKKRTG